MYTINEENKERIAELIRIIARRRKNNLSITVSRRIISPSGFPVNADIWRKNISPIAARNISAKQIIPSIVNRVVGANLLILVHSINERTYWTELAEETIIDSSGE